MKGSMKERSPGTWQLVVDLPRGVDGKRKQKYVTVKCKNSREAQKALNKLLAEVESGTYIDPSKSTVGAYLKHWLEHTSGTRSAKSQERYTEVVTKHLIPALGCLPIAKLKPMHIQAYYSDAAKTGRRDGTGGLAPRTIEYHHHVLHKALADAVKWELIPRNPASVITPPKADRHEIDVLSAQETIQLLLAANGTPWNIPVLLAVTTGMRRGEICALDWSSVDLDNGTLAVRRTLQQTKTGLSFKEPKTVNSIRVIALLPMTVEALKKHKESQKEHAKKYKGIYTNNGLVYCKEDGSPYCPDSLSHNFHRVLELAKLSRRRFHDLRHTHATLLLEQGIHPKVVQERLGHASIVVTQDIYSHVLPSIQREAALRLQETFTGKIGVQSVCMEKEKPSPEASEG